jgi:hypothetical protein
VADGGLRIFDADWLPPVTEADRWRWRCEYLDQLAAERAEPGRRRLCDELNEAGRPWPRPACR